MRMSSRALNDEREVIDAFLEQTLCEHSDGRQLTADDRGFHMGIDEVYSCDWSSVHHPSYDD